MYICLLVKMSKNPTMSSSYLFLILDTFFAFESNLNRLFDIQLCSSQFPNFTS